jgi:gamma-glutamyl AIG2-like cyclotransferase
MPLLFSYGTLREPAVQQSLFGRLLDGTADELVGFAQSLRKVEDPGFVAASGTADHAVVRFDGRCESRVPGIVFEVSDAELVTADRYEPAGYERTLTTLASGKRAWVYVASDSTGGPAAAGDE